MVHIISHTACLEHDPGQGHPEHAGRLQAVLEAIEPLGLPRSEASTAGKDALLRVHHPDHVERILALQVDHGSRFSLDADTICSSGSLEAALRAAGAAIDGVRMAIAHEANKVFCAVRPPGHHAESHMAMGFCLFNSIAVGAAEALESLDRVAIIDFDVHHGNGTQQIFFNDPRVLYVSSHQAPLYPGTGQATDAGIANNIVNFPLPPGAGTDAFRSAWQEGFSAIDRFAPQLILVSAGFDAHHLDPLADLNLTTADYSWLTAELAGLARIHSGGRMVSMLEGGYSLAALRECIPAHLHALSD